jgi:YidC/Oxa1 family membrane protein insertase
MMMPVAVKEYPTDSKKEKKEKEDNEDMMMAMQGQMMFLMPIMIGYFAFQFPVGLAIYWNTFTILGIVQQYLLSGWGGMKTLFPLKKD